MTPSNKNLRCYGTPRFRVLGIKGIDADLDPDNSSGVAGRKATTTRRPGQEGLLSQQQQQSAVFLDINEPYTRNVILKAFAHHRSLFSVELGPGGGADAVKLPPGCDFQWSEYERIDWESVLAGKHGASCYCIRKGLSRKAQLAYYTHRHVCKNPDSVLRQAIPRTLIIDTWPVWEEDDGDGGGGESRRMEGKEGLADVVVAMGNKGNASDPNRRKKLDACLRETKKAMDEAEEAYENDDASDDKDPPVWILKPSTVNKGAGIKIVHLYEQLVDICWSEPNIREWVLQRYISDPLLLRKRKFHIRAYALAVSALKVYLHEDCLALCAGTRYRKSDPSNMFAHITNTAYQDLDPRYDERKCVLAWNDDDAAPLLVRDGTCRDLKEAGERIRRVRSELGTITGELFRAYQNEFSVFSPIAGCFEHFGLDFIVDRNWRVHLLEVNPGPDFKQTGNRLNYVIENLMRDTIDTALLCGGDGGRRDAAAAGRNNASTHERSSNNKLKLVYEDEAGGKKSRDGMNIKMT